MNAYLNELKEKSENIKELIKEQEQKAQWDKAAESTMGIYKAYVDAGFTEEQAWQIIINMIQTAFNGTGR